MSSQEAGQRWFIDLDWHQPHDRSLSTLVQTRLCAKCQQRGRKKGGEIPIADLLATIADCCAKKRGFITDQQPLAESVFRLFLANGNQPLDLTELGKQLMEKRGGKSYRTSVEILSRLLESDQYYGLKAVTD